MNRPQLVEEALQAAKHSRHNLAHIKRYPDSINHGKQTDAVGYLETMIRVAELETKRGRHVRRPLIDRFIALIKRIA